jgi:hypothetical protein
MLPENKFQQRDKALLMKKQLTHGAPIKKMETKTANIFNTGASQKQMQGKPNSRSGVSSAKPTTIEAVSANVRTPLERRKSTNCVNG